MIITTAPKPTSRSVEQASLLAAELKTAARPRKGMSVRKLLELSGDNRVIIVTDTETRFYSHPEEPPLFFHPSMALIRAKRLRKGESDPLVELSRCKPGDRIIDCTAGMAGDALVFAYAAGDTGEVTAIESEPVLCALVREGLKHYDTGLPDVNEAMRRIEMHCGNHAEYLASQPDKSADIVYFDPMFRQPIMESAAIGAFRSLANMDELGHEVVEQAKRVARKTVIMKENGISDEFSRLGFTRSEFKSSKIAYGVITID